MMCEDDIDDEERRRLLKEGFHEYDEVICAGCDEPIDLSDADDLTEASEMWNDHIRTEHTADD